MIDWTLSRRGGAAACLVLASLALASPACAAPAKGALVEEPDDSMPASAGVTQVIDWVLSSGDNNRLPFMVIDKVGARIFVFDADGEFLDSTPALLGVARGDDSTPGVGDRELSDIPPEDRTTPAGRFRALYGPAAGNKRVLWIDYATAISLHAVITTNKAERRPERLKSPTPKDNRITFGCINISAAFYQNIVRALFEDNGGMVYILPETWPLAEAFPTLQPKALFAQAPRRSGRGSKGAGDMNGPSAARGDATTVAGQRKKPMPVPACGGSQSKCASASAFSK